MGETPHAQLSPRERWQQENDEANERLNKLAADTTQREWLTITTALDRTRQQIGADNGLTLLAMAWVHEKRAHGGASWDRLLDMTDDQLAQLHGYPEGDGSEPTPAPTTADQIADAAMQRPWSAQNGADASTSAQASSAATSPAAEPAETPQA